jgi:chemotaxis protein CheC
VNDVEIDRLGELANIGAGHAADAFSRLAGRPIWMSVPKIHSSSVPFVNERESDEADWSTGVFFEFDGYLQALVGILFHGASSERVVRAVVGEPDETIPLHSIESALLEIGNILASHVASAIAVTVGQRLLPSIPTLAMHHAEEKFVAMLECRPGRHPIRIECELSDESGELAGLLVMVPDA